MCDICTTVGLEWKFINGKEKNKLYRVRLFRVYQDRIAVVSMCHIHAIELFILGEQRFLRNYPKFSQRLALETSRFSSAA